MAAASLAVQAHANVRIDGRVIPLSLFHLTVGESGERKSALDTAALRPHREYQKELYAQYEIALETFRKDEAAFKKTEAQVLNKEKSLEGRRIQLDALGKRPEPPLPPVLVLDDLTIEGVLKQLQLGLPSLGIFSDEGGKIAGGHAMNNDNQLKTVSSLSNLWDGKPTTRVRSGEGTTVLYGKRAALHLMMQPSVAALLVNNELLRDQGFLSRCLTAWPQSTTGTRMYKEVDLYDTNEMRRYETRITHILHTPLPLRQDTRNELEPRSVQLSPAAKRIWVAFHDHVEAQLPDDEKLGTIRGFASKAAEHAIRVAGVLTLIADIDATEIDEIEIKAGIELMEFYLAEALRIREAAEEEPAARHAGRIHRWCGEKGIQMVRIKELMQFGPRPRRAEDVRSAMVVLVDTGFAETVEAQKSWKIL